MKGFDLRGFSERQRRFRRPEFQKKLRAARGFERRSEPRPQNIRGQLLRTIGLHILWRQILVVLVLGAAAYFLTLSPVFLVSEVEVESGGFSATEVSRAIAGMGASRKYLIPTNHILIVNAESVLTALQEEFPQIRSVTSFSRSGWDRVKLGIEERKSSYVWQSAGEFFLLDQDGVIFQRVLNYDPTSFPETLLVDRSDRVMQIGGNVSAEKILQFVEKLKTLWSDVVTQITWRSFSFPGAASLDIAVRTSTGFQIYFDVERPATAQLRNLNLLLTREIKPETYTGLSYIDLRLPDVAYYCYLDAPCASENATSTQAISR